MLKKIAAVFLSVMLLAAGAGSYTGHSVHAAGSTKIIVNGQALQLEGTSAYMNGQKMMLPLRETAEALQYKVSYTGSTGTFLLERFQASVKFSLSGQEIVLDGNQKVPYSDRLELKQKKAYAPLSFFAAIGFVTAYSSESGQVEVYAPEVTAGAVAGLLASGDYQALRERYFGKDTEQLSVPVIQQSWQNAALPAGKYFGVKSTESMLQEGTMTIVSVLSFSKSEAMLTLELNSSGKLTKLTLTPILADTVTVSPVK